MDVWYIGVLLIILLSNNPVVLNKKDYWTLSGKHESDKESAERNIHYVSLAGLEFIDKLLRFKCNDRPHTEDILKLPYLTNLEKMRTSPTLGNIIAKHGSTFST